MRSSVDSRVYRGSVGSGDGGDGRDRGSGGRGDGDSGDGNGSSGGGRGDSTHTVGSTIGDHIEWNMPNERIASLLLSRKELERADRKGVDDTNRCVECC